MYRRKKVLSVTVLDYDSVGSGPALNRYCSTCLFLDCTRSEVTFISIILSATVPSNRESYNHFSKQTGMICCEHTKISLLRNESMYNIIIKSIFFLYQDKDE